MGKEEWVKLESTIYNKTFCKKENEGFKNPIGDSKKKKPIFKQLYKKLHYIKVPSKWSPWKCVLSCYSYLIYRTPLSEFFLDPMHFVLLVIILVKLTHKINHHSNVFSNGKIFLFRGIHLIFRNGKERGLVKQQPNYSWSNTKSMTTV